MRRFFKGFFYFDCHGNQNFLQNTIIWRNLKEYHLRNIPVKFRKNPVNSFSGEVFRRKSLRTHARTDGRTHDGHNALTIQVSIIFSFSQMFLPFPKQTSIFQSQLFCGLQIVSIWTSLKFVHLINSQDDYTETTKNVLCRFPLYLNNVQKPITPVWKPKSVTDPNRNFHNQTLLL